MGIDGKNQCIVKKSYRSSICKVYRKILPLSEAQKVWKKQLKIIANLIKVSSQFDLENRPLKKLIP
jgi:hypothetical protein